MYSVNLCPSDHNAALSPALKTNLVETLQDYFNEHEVSFWESNLLTQSGKLRANKEFVCPHCAQLHTMQTEDLMQFNRKLAAKTADQVTIEMPCCHHISSLAEMGFQETVFSNWGINIKAHNRAIVEEFLHHKTTPVPLTIVEQTHA
ncbi:hypothetical protein [Vibrio gallicus]|uniref:hypothetical protein n=1 Tax=Vibrio gallicus TaxID=190897 RepID=UPI0021C43AD4|nr:hypothetical protein [Vibrio gallicus]